ncbi:MAG TPA: efflux RND transporter periplasmic adaptor subunit [Xanthomonadaceae bacterium]|nr:efflux RND transporter periplasmic adaptor subunit [Xanthomonadaceae bacterium]
MSANRFIYATLLLAAALALAACGNGQDAAAPARPVMVVQPAQAAESFAVYPGEVRARHEPALAFRIGGKLAERRAEVGERVREGQVLARLDPQDTRLQVDAVQAQLAAARADLELAEAERARFAQMRARGLVSASAFETHESAAKSARARVRQAEAQLANARNQAEYATLRAPADGVIVQRLAEAGQVLAAGHSVYVLARDGEREVVIALPESQIDRFAVGQPVAVALWSAPDRRHPGTIRELAPAADAGARTFAARVAFPAEAAGAELGQSARVYVAGDTEDALAVPLSAVSADAEQPYVFVLESGGSRLARREVALGRFTEHSATVTAGLHAQDWIVAAGVHLLREGQAVRPVDRDNRPVVLAAQ